jgi:hypothetical protein
MHNLHAYIHIHTCMYMCMPPTPQRPNMTGRSGVPLRCIRETPRRRQRSHLHPSWPLGRPGVAQRRFANVPGVTLAPARMGTGHCERGLERAPTCTREGSRGRRRSGRAWRVWTRLTTLAHSHKLQLLYERRLLAPCTGKPLYCCCPLRTPKQRTTNSRFDFSAKKDFFLSQNAISEKVFPSH